MELVLDNNIFFSLMNPDSVNSYLFSLLNAKFFAPEYLKEELEEHKAECLVKSNLSEHEFKIRQKEIEDDIKLFEFSKYKAFLKEAINSLSDPEDSPYVALALSINASIWSNDNHITSQSLVKSFTTNKLFSKMIAGKV